MIPALLPGVEWVAFDDGSEGDFVFAIQPEPVKGPEVPPPCWDARPVSADAAMKATRALCGG